MKERTRKIFIMIVMAALIVSLTAASFAALTYGRYTGGKLDEDSPYDEIIDFVGATAFEVTSPDAFINAINNGYSYIKIADDAEEPFVINNDVADVYTNLVLDVNGHVVVRNSRNPLLDVRRSISVVLVYDSSTDADGGFYNPVGSSLQTSGGTLTVGEGVYESGPNEEHQTKSYTTGTQVTLFTRGNNRTATSYSETGTPASDLPILTGRNAGTQEDPVSVYDFYFESAPGGNVNSLIEDDTYLLYTVEKNGYEENGQLYVNAKKNDGGTLITAEEFSPICNVASCDFYYYYPVNGTPGKADSPQTYAVIYGYNDVKALASNKNGAAETLRESGLVWPYAAIRSVEDEDTQEGGVTHARGGVFKTHFGEENTYCIYSAGGTMTVGTSGSAGGPSFEAVGSGVCIAMTGASDNVSEGGSLTISGGTFSSRLGNTIEMENGNMTVTAGAFTKTGCKKGTGDKQLENQTAIISLTGGTLNVSGTKTGDTYSVTMTAGGAGNGGTLENVFGIRADDGGEISTKGVSFHIYGDYSAGVLSYDGKIDLGNDTAITVTQSNEKQDGDHILLTSAGVSSEQASEGEEHPVNLSGNVTIASNGLGITARGAVNVTEGTTTVTTPRGTGIYVNGGTFRVESDATISVTSTVRAGYAWGLPPEGQGTAPNIYNGVYVQGGSLESKGTLNVTFTGVQNESHDSYDALNIRSYAVRVETAASGGKTEVSIAGGTISNSVGGGVYVGGGAVTLGVENGDGPTIGTTGVSFGDENTSAGGGNWKYYENKTGGHAVEVSGGDLFVYGGLYTAALGNGILVRDGNAWVLNGTFQGNDTKEYRDLYEGNLPAGPAAYYALKLLGGSVTTFGGTFGTYRADNITHTAEGSSAFVTGVDSQATANIYGGSFKVGGQAGFSVYQNVALEFTPNEEKTVNGQTLKGSAVTVSATTTAIAIENTTEQSVSVTINGGTFESTGTDDGKRDGIWYSNPYAKLTINQLEGQSTKISANEQHGIRLVHAPDTKGGVKITGGTITGAQHGILYVDTTDNGSAASVNDGLLIEGGTITGSNGSGLYFAVNPWQDGGTNNVAIVGGTFNGEPEKKGSNPNPYYINGAISAPSSGATNIDYDGLGHDIRLGDILKTHTGDGKVAYVKENLAWNGNTPLGDNYNYSIAVTVSSLSQVTIIPY